MERRVATVFGGSGFIGRHVVQRLAAAGYIVRVAVRDPEAALFLKTAGDVGQVVPMAIDITHEGHVEAAVADADVVINLVGILYERGKNSLYGRELTFQALHVDGAATVARASQAAGVRHLIHMSALGADPHSPAAYGRSKAAGEAAVRDTFADAVILRPSVVFGPEDNFFNMFAGMARLSMVLPVLGCPTWPQITFPDDDRLIAVDFYGDGGTRFQPVYVGDVADAVMAGIAGPEARGQTFELGGPRTYSFKQIMELLLSQIGRWRLLLPFPLFWARFYAWFLEFLPVPPLTRDQVDLLKRDNVVGENALTFKELGIMPTAAEAILPTYLHRFRPPSRQHPRTA